jgi:hypothetical protein
MLFKLQLRQVTGWILALIDHYAWLLVTVADTVTADEFIKFP